MSRNYPNARPQNFGELPSAKNQPDNVYRDFFTYTARVSDLAVSSTQAVNVTIDSDASFTLVKLCFFANLDGEDTQTDSTAVVPLVRVSIQDTGSGRNLQSAPVPIFSYAGRGQLPFILPVPKIFAANTTIRFTFDNYSSTVQYGNVELALQGYKSYIMGQ
jgi:hypothetical protein